MQAATDPGGTPRRGTVTPGHGHGTAPDVHIRTFGGFDLTIDGVTTALPAGLPTTAIKVAVTNGGHVHVEVVMEHLWPDRPPAVGRKGVRNVLNRLTRVGVPLLQRDGEVLRLADHVRVDAAEFVERTDAAVIAADRTTATRHARHALSLYRGEFLADDRYVDWTEPHRRRLRRRRLMMLELLARDARDHGDSAGAIHLTELALEDDPTDEHLHLELAGLLLQTGRRARAAGAIESAAHVLEHLGLTPDASWALLRLQLAHGRTTTPSANPSPAPTPRSNESPRNSRHLNHHRQTVAGTNHRGAST